MIKKLEQYIANNDFKKKKIARDLGISNVYLSYILHGSKYPSQELEAKIRQLIS